MIAIQTHNLTKKYKEKIAVNELNLAIEQGELFALLGVNGAGKSTIIKLLSCLLTPTSGDATLLGNSLISAPNEIKKIINVSPQETAIGEQLCVRENLEFIARIYGSSKTDAKQQTRDILAKFDLTEVAESKVKKLSGGMKRRLSIAMALITNPKILFLDEPTLGLDVIARRELWNSINKLKGEVTIILTTHYMEEAEQLADHIGIIAKGELRAVGTLNKLTDMTGTTTLEEAFVKLASTVEVKK